MDKPLLAETQDRLHAARHELEQELDRQLEDSRLQSRCRLQRGEVCFHREMHALQKTYRTGLWPQGQPRRASRLLIRAFNSFV